jgi:hypothetical protein
LLLKVADFAVFASAVKVAIPIEAKSNVKVNNFFIFNFSLLDKI